LTTLFAQTIPNQGGAGIAAFLPFLLIGIIFYVFIIRPQSKQKKNHDEMLENLKKGDKIITRGGLYGKIINFQGKNDNIVIIDIGSNVQVNISRSFVNTLSNKNE